MIVGGSFGVDAFQTLAEAFYNPASALRICLRFTEFLTGTSPELGPMPTYRVETRDNQDFIFLVIDVLLVFVGSSASGTTQSF